MRFVEMYSNMVIKPLEEQKKKLTKKLCSDGSQKELIQEMVDKIDIELYKKYERLTEIAKEEYEFSQSIIKNNETN